MTRRLATLVGGIVFAAAAWLGDSAPLSAHAFLQHSLPAVGGTVHGSPPKLELWYSEGVEPAFTKVALTGADGQPIAVGPLIADPADKTHISFALPPLPPGHYRVSWQAVSVDTHRTSGSFSFTVAP